MTGIGERGRKKEGKRQKWGGRSAFGGDDAEIPGPYGLDRARRAQFLSSGYGEGFQRSGVYSGSGAAGWAMNGRTSRSEAAGRSGGPAAVFARRPSEPYRSGTRRGDGAARGRDLRGPARGRGLVARMNQVVVDTDVASLARSAFIRRS